MPKGKLVKSRLPPPPVRPHPLLKGAKVSCGDCGDVSPRLPPLIAVGGSSVADLNPHGVGRGVQEGVGWGEACILDVYMLAPRG